MRRDIAIRWAEMLLSNPEVQGQGRLAPDDNHRCCLGVLTEMVEGGCGVHDNYLSDVTQARTGIKSWSGLIPSTRVQLSFLNDMGGTFKEIALLIEKHSEEL